MYTSSSGNSVLQTLQIISEINEEFYNQVQDEQIYLDYLTNGYAELIHFMGYEIWNSENDCRPYVDEEKDIRQNLDFYLRVRINEIIKMISKIKMDLFCE